VVDLVGRRRDERGRDTRGEEQRREVRDRDRGAAAADAAGAQPLDRRIEREGKKQRYDDPRDHLPRDPDDVEPDPDGQQHDQDGQDRPGAEVDEPLWHHRGESIAEAPDVYRRGLRAGGIA
jgi:hypothetical protein